MELHGHVAPGFGPVHEALADAIAVQGGTGAAVAAWHDGRWVADLCGGRGWEPGGLVQPYSVSKPFAAMCVLLLVERGRIDLDAPVRRYWPEFRADATVRHLLSHRAGVVALDEPAPTEVFYDWGRLCGMLARQRPAWEPGTAHGESALFYGHLVGELVRRVDGRTLGGFLRDEITGPSGLDFHIGLRAPELSRVVDLTGLDAGFRQRAGAGRPALYERAISNPPGVQDPAVVNGTAWRAAEVPAVNGHGTARSVAGLYAALLRGDLLGPGLTAEATTPQGSGPDRVFGGERRWGLGFALDETGFGMGGLGGSLAWACPADGYAFAFVTAAMDTSDRATPLENALRSCLGLPAL